MLSVLRFTIDHTKLEDLTVIGNKIEAAEPGAIEARKKGDGFTCPIEDSDRWAHHTEEVSDFVGMHDAAIREAVALGARVTFDVGIEPEDQAAQKYALLLLAQAPLLATLGAAGIDLEISIYRPALATDGA